MVIVFFRHSFGIGIMETPAEIVPNAAVSPDKRALYLRMASVWHQMALRWERGVLPKSKKTLPRCPKCNEPMRAVEYATFNCVPCEITLSYGNHEDEGDR